MVIRKELEEILFKQDLVEYFSNMSKNEIEEIFGDKVSRMVGFDQKNIHHCYDLLGHILHTVQSISEDNMSKDDLVKLKVASFFHDIGKPDVAIENPKTGQQVFYGHAQKSKEISMEILEQCGYSKDEINQICFYIEHHDDFISYKSKVPDYMKTHEFIREIDVNSVCEKIIENRYDFNKMGLDKDQIRYVCYYLARNEEPKFTSPNGIIDINVDMIDVKDKMASKEYMSSYNPTARDYKLLVNLCKADATAQTEIYKKDGKVMCSRKEKLDNMNNIESNIELAYKKAEDICLNLEYDKELDNRIQDVQAKNLELKSRLYEVKELKDEYELILKDEEKNLKKREENIDAI